MEAVYDAGGQAAFFEEVKSGVVDSQGALKAPSWDSLEPYLEEWRYESKEEVKVNWLKFIGNLFLYLARVLFEAVVLGVILAYILVEILEIG